jgi:prolyl-tRNA synthetase
MRLSTLFGQRLREIPSDAELPGHQLALRAGLMRQVAQGIYALLPVGWRVIRRIEAIIREEMDAIEGQEISMPMVQPAELWQASGRYQAASPGPALARFRDRSGQALVLGMTHEGGDRPGAPGDPLLPAVALPGVPNTGKVQR